jgi:hypothetical protein
MLSYDPWMEAYATDRCNILPYSNAATGRADGGGMDQWN